MWVRKFGSSTWRLWGPDSGVSSFDHMIVSYFKNYQQPQLYFQEYTFKSSILKTIHRSGMQFTQPRPYNLSKIDIT